MIYEKTIAPFGVVTACHAADYWMVKACCASIRFYSGDVPICLVADGEFDTSEVERAYGVLVLRTGELPVERMRRVCCGSPRSKLAAHWFGPFERYLFIDCDAIFGAMQSLLSLIGAVTLLPSPIPVAHRLIERKLNTFT